MKSQSYISVYLFHICIWSYWFSIIIFIKNRKPEIFEKELKIAKWLCTFTPVMHNMAEMEHICITGLFTFKGFLTHIVFGKFIFWRAFDEAKNQEKSDGCKLALSKILQITVSKMRQGLLFWNYSNREILSGRHYLRHPILFSWIFKKKHS